MSGKELRDIYKLFEMLDTKLSLNIEEEIKLERVK